MRTIRPVGLPGPDSTLSLTRYWLKADCDELAINTYQLQPLWDLAVPMTRQVPAWPRQTIALVRQQWSRPDATYNKSSHAIALATRGS